MAEPARKFDPRDEESYWEPEVIQGGGRGDGKPSGDLKAVDDLAESEANPDNQAIDNASNFAKEELPKDNDFEYSAEPKKKKFKLKKNWKKIALGGGILGFVGGTIGLLFFLLPSLKVAHLVNNLEQRFMGVAANAIEQRAETLFSRYVRNRVFPLVKACGNLVTPECSAGFDPGRGIASNLFSNWRDANIEQKVFTERGLRVEYNRGTDRYTIFRTGTAGVDFDGPNFELNDFDGRDVGKSELRREIKKALKEFTFWERVMLRGPVRRLAARRWNVRWCFFACKTIDNIRESSFSAAQRLKLKMIERTIAPFSDRLAVYFTCAVSDCANQEFLRQRSRTLARAVEEIGEAELKKITDGLNRNNRRVSQALVERILTAAFNETTGKAGAASIPVIGWIYIVDAVNEIDTKLYNGFISQYLADNTAAQYAEFYLNFRTHFDEAIDDQLSLEEVGAQSQLFEGLEGSLVYQQELGTGITGSAASSSGPEGYVCADGNPIPSGQLVCEERKVGKTSGYDSWRLSDEAALLSGAILGGYRCGPFLGISIAIGNDCAPGSPEDDEAWLIDEGIHEIFSVLNSVLEVLGKVVVGAIRVVAGPLYTWFEERLGDLAQMVLEHIFTFIQAGAGPGHQVFDDLYAGADVVGNDFAKGLEDPNSGELFGLGGQLLTDEEVQDNITYLEQNELEEFRQQPLFARLFSTQDSNSLISQVAMLAPADSSLSGIKQFMASLFNPISLVANLGTSLASPVYAQTYQYQGDPFEIDQYGYAVDDPLFSLDPEEITEGACVPGGELYEDWKDGIIGDDPGEKTQNGQIMNTEPNPCMLEYSTVNVLSSWFTNADDGGL